MSIAIAILFILLGLAIKNGKMYYLIAGYNSMSKEQQATYDIERIATLFRNIMFLMSFILIVGFGISQLMTDPRIEVYVVCFTVLTGVTYLIIASNSKKYKNKR